MIGRRLNSIKDFIEDGRIQIILTDQLIEEIELVTKRPKLQKYFPETAVSELLDLLETIGKHFSITPKFKLVRDEKDNFLLDLIAKSKADFLVTGDKDLLELEKFQTARIVTPTEFEELLA